jgi:hypothetical protein
MFEFEATTEIVALFFLSLIFLRYKLRHLKMPSFSAYKGSNSRD